MRRWYTIALACLVIAASIGTLLRAIYVVEMPGLDFMRWLDAHSHLAMLGWAFTGLFIALLDQEEHVILPQRFRWLMAGSLMATTGMVLSYLLFGHGAGSIGFSVIQILMAYGLVAIAWRAMAHWPVDGSRLLARIALVLLVISTVGEWAMGPIVYGGLQGTEIYYWSEQFFLHFQFNGWFWFGAMAVGSRWAELHGVPGRIDRFTTWLWLISALLTFALVIAWSERFLLVLAVNSAGVLIQFWAAWRTLMAMRNARPQALVRTTTWMRVCIGALLFAMAVKVTIQAAVAVPVMAEMALIIRNYVIGFIHVNTLGIVTSLLFAHGLMRGWFDERRVIIRAGLGLFFLGVAASELLLFTQGTMLWVGMGLMPGFYWTLLAFSMLLPVGAILLLIHLLRSGAKVTRVAA